MSPIIVLLLRLRYRLLSLAVLFKLILELQLPTNLDELEPNTAKFLDVLAKLKFKDAAKYRLVYAGSMINALKELYSDDKDFMKDLVWSSNPFMSLIPKDNK